MVDLSTEIVVLLVIAAFAAGFIDSIAGGGGLIALPALLIAGLGPVEALGTNKVQGLFGTASATIAYAAKGHVDVRRQALPFLLSLVGSIVGAAMATVLPGDILHIALPFMLVGIALFFALKPNMNDVDRAERLSPLLFGLIVAPAIGFYDGLFGPGTGALLMIAYVALAGYGVLKATAHTKLLNFASNIGGVATFAMAGVIYWKVGLLMGIAQFLGARIGATLAMRIGSRIIKPLLIVVCIVLTLKLLSDPSHPLRLMLGL